MSRALLASWQVHEFGPGLYPERRDGKDGALDRWLGRLLGRWLLGNLVAIAGRIGLGQRGAHFVHFEPVGMKDNTPHAPFMLLGLGCTYALIYYGVL